MPTTPEPTAPSEPTGTRPGPPKPQASPASPASLDSLLATSGARSPHRCCFLLHVRPDRLAEYVEVHQHVWEEMREALTRTGWRNYSLFLRPEDGLVVGYFESDDVAAAMAAMEDEDVNTRWQNEMAQYFVQPGGGTAVVLPQYFRLF